MVPASKNLCLPLSALIWLSFPLSVLAHVGILARIEAVTKQIESDSINAELYLERGELHRLHKGGKDVAQGLFRQ